MLNILRENKEIILVKFPILFPLLYGLILYIFPEFETQLIFITILILAEPHFGATWPFFLNSVNDGFIKSKRNDLMIIPSLIIIGSLLGFFLFKNLFLLIFFAANIYHVMRQSFGFCKLYCKNEYEKKIQEYLIYFFNFLFFLIALFRFYFPLIQTDDLIILNLIVISMFLLISIYYVYKFKFTQNFLVFLTGCLIFFPTCFVINPVHAIIMGVTMHYTQYLFLTHNVHTGRKKESSNENNFSNKKYFLIIALYAIVMSIFSIFGKFDANLLKSLILVPIIGQMLHFYLDSQLWKFSEKHNRDNVLRHIKIV